ncbi:MAG: hypothetical protein ABJA93_07620 [Sporichthyaceae bacterium]
MPGNRSRAAAVLGGAGLDDSELDEVAGDGVDGEPDWLRAPDDPEQAVMSSALTSRVREPTRR